MEHLLLNQCLTNPVLMHLTFLLAASSVESKLVKHVFEVDYGSRFPDGVKADWMMRINKGFPGPTIEAQVGDILQVDVINKIQDGQNMTIHWHGLNQRHFQFQDGPSMVTQCPIRYGQSHRYKFPLAQWGTYWYHSHIGSQYGEGLWGALIIRNKKEIYSYDGEITLRLSDWYHTLGPENTKWYLSTASEGLPPFPDSLLLNGRGRYNCPEAWKRNRICFTAQQRRQVYKIPVEKRYRIRVVNTSSRTTFNFSIDNHKLETIEVDGVDVLPPVVAHIAEIGPGQRYSFLVTTDQKGEKNEFLIRAEGDLFPPPSQNANQCANCTIKEVTALLRYDRKDKRISSSMEQFDYSQIVPQKKPINRNEQLLDESFLIPHDKNLAIAPSPVDRNIVLNASRSLNSEGTPRFYFNGTRFHVPDDKPILHKILDNDPLPDCSLTSH